MGATLLKVNLTLLECSKLPYLNRSGTAFRQLLPGTYILKNSHSFEMKGNRHWQGTTQIPGLVLEQLDIETICLQISSRYNDWFKEN